METTKSEALFSNFCGSLGYGIEPVPVREVQTPDFKVRVSDCEFYAEVKELEPNDQDLILLARAQRGEAISVTFGLGLRARALIDKAANQLRAVKGDNLPGVIVLYDNIRLEDGTNLGLSPLNEDHITTALFGDWVVDVELENGTGGVFQSGDRHGPHEIVKRGRKEYLSAVIVLRDDGGPLTALVYHNPFTAIALPVPVFAGINCQHFMVPPDQAKKPQSWVRFR